MIKTAFLFPGQGAQYPGMGQWFANNFKQSLDVYSEASEVLKYDMLKICLEGPPRYLLKTEVAQPAILVTSVAILKTFESEGFTSDITAGLSLGEFTALVNANSLSFPDAVKITERRGFFMEEAVAYDYGGMAAIIGLTIRQLEKCIELAACNDVVEVANHNSQYQVVISGEKNAVKKVSQLAKERGAVKVLKLPVKHPFHSSLMDSAGEKLQELLNNCSINVPRIPVIANYNAKQVFNETDIVKALVKQISNTIHWYDTIVSMLEQGVNCFIEIGPGNALTKFVIGIADHKKYNITALNIEDEVSFKSAISKLNGA